MSQELLQVQEDGQLIDQYLRQEAPELEQRGTVASERSPERESSVAEAATGSLLLSLMQQERDDKSIIGGSLIGKTTLGNGVCVCSN